MKIEINIEATIDEKTISTRSPLIKILRLLNTQSDVKWKCEQKNILADKIKKRKYIKKEIVVNTVLPEFPLDNILTFN
jgi:hypothetical protein